MMQKGVCMVKGYIITPRYGYMLEVKLPSMKIVCPYCHGEGTHTNRSIDGNGLTQRDLEFLDSEFSRSYIRGDYDITCESCKGLRVIDVPNVDAMSKKLKEAYYKAEEAIREDEMVAYYEQRWFERGF
jgi:hypothetical protein